ncbi:MAG TPA: chromosomal replication initiator protein DnaA [Candidatus Eisenbacteria bacterium]|jgi:chromosomal replication initiator protein|nr:chromosomal replication initiator protein DnaA [Candidatus Eisenbacteria bacterium]
MPELWTQAVAEIKERIGRQNYETWIKPIGFISRNKNEICLDVPNKFFRDWLTEHYLIQIQDILSALAKHDVKVVFEINEKTNRQANAEKGVKREERERVQKSNSNLVPKYTFQNFVVGASNQFAHAACVAVANQPGEHYNPLFIYGGVGLGKTHLVNAIGHQSAQRSGLKVVYLSSESFMNELIGSLRRDKMDEFKKKFRNVDILILDDVQFIAGKERTQEEFFHTFNSLYESHKQIVITSDKFPKEIPGIEDRLRNRFEWGLIADIQPPDMETRVAILQKKAENEGVQLPHDVAFFLASNIDSNVRELEGSLTRLGAFSSLTKATITVELAKDVLKNTLKNAQQEITVENIQKTICDYFNLKIGDLKAKRRTQNIALPRQVAMYLCRKYTETSFPAIGDKFGGRDHSTVIHASKTIERKIKEDPHMQTTIEKLERNLNIRKRV